MSVSKFFTRLALTAAVVGWASGSAFAADFVPPPPPVIVGATPVTVGEVSGCASCESPGVISRGGFFKGHRSGCDPLLAKNRPYAGVSPNACFGYFPTQWQKWEDVCPPLAGAVVPGAIYPRPGEIVVPPRAVDPKSDDPRMPEPRKPETKVGARPSTLPTVPQVGARPGASPHSTAKPSTLPTIPQAPPVMTSKFYP